MCVGVRLVDVRARRLAGGGRWGGRGGGVGLDRERITQEAEAAGARLVREHHRVDVAVGIDVGQDVVGDTVLVGVHDRHVHGAVLVEVDESRVDDAGPVSVEVDRVDDTGGVRVGHDHVDDAVRVTVAEGGVHDRVTVGVGEGLVGDPVGVTVRDHGLDLGVVARHEVAVVVHGSSPVSAQRVTVSHATPGTGQGRWSRRRSGRGASERAECPRGKHALRTHPGSL